MAKSKKATKKFKANHLDRTIQKRKAEQNKQRKRQTGIDKVVAPVEEDSVTALSSSAPPQSVSSSLPSSSSSQLDKDVQRFLSSTLVDDIAEDDSELDDDDIDLDDEGPEVLLTDHNGAANIRENGHTKQQEEEDGLDDSDEFGDEQEDDDEEADDAELEDSDGDTEESLMAQIDALKDKDPEFYKHLQENDAQLLQFNADNEEEQQDKEEEDEESEEVDKLQSKQKQYKESASAGLASWKPLKQQVVKHHSLTALRKVLRLYRAACHRSDEPTDDGKDSEDDSALTNAALYDQLIQFGLSHLPSVFLHHLQFTDGPQQPSTSTKKKQSRLITHPRFKILGPLLKSYLTNYLHALQALQEHKLIRLFLSTLLQQLLPLFDPFPKLAHRLLKLLLHLWSTADRNTRIDAFLCIRSLCLSVNPKHGLLEEALKGLYLTYVKYAKFCNALTLNVIEFMSNCIVELYLIDPVMSYQHAFVYIRQLAIHLRSATMHGKTTQASTAESGKAGGAGQKGKRKKGKSSDSGDAGYKSVYNWQFVNCLRVWTKVLSSPLACNPVVSTSATASAPPNPYLPSTLRPLLYPFVQISLGVLSLLPSTRYHPLRLMVSSFLIHLCSACHVFIPLLPTLLNIFSSAELTRKPVASTKKIHDIHYVLKVSANTVLTKAYQEQLCQYALQLLLQYCTVYSYSIAFPELILPIQRILKKFQQNTQIHHLRKQMKVVLDKLELNAEWINQQRNSSAMVQDKNPRDVLNGTLDSMYTFKPASVEEEEREEEAGEGKKKRSKAAAGSQSGISPLARYEKLHPLEDPRNGVKDDDTDWDGSVTAGEKKNKQKARGTNADEEEEELEDEEASDEEEDEEMDEEAEEEVVAHKKSKKKQRLESEQNASRAATKPPASRKAMPARSSLPDEDDDFGAQEDIVTELVLSEEDEE